MSRQARPIYCSLTVLSCKEEWWSRHTSYSATASFHDLISAESSQISAWLSSALFFEALCLILAFLFLGMIIQKWAG